MGQLLLGLLPATRSTLVAAEPTDGWSASVPVPQPGVDPFYQPPDPLPDAPSGTVLRSRPVRVRLDRVGLVPSPVRAWQVLYVSTSALGVARAVSGTVMVPLVPWLTSTPRPIVTYTMGTHGLGDQRAPSYQLRTGQEVELGLVVQALARGWAVAVTDYEGLGTPGVHTYVVGPSEGRSVLDAARAAQLLSMAGLGTGGPVGIWGYSQGGQAAAWAGELYGSYAPELQVVGVAAGGVPADLEVVTRHLDGGPAAGLVLAGAVGFAGAYPELSLDTLLNESGKAAAAKVAESCTGEIVSGNASRRLLPDGSPGELVTDPAGGAR